MRIVLLIAHDESRRPRAAPASQRASELLRLVEQGVTIEVTDRGRPVALLTPLPQGSAFQRMVAAGEVDLAAGSIDDLPAPLPSRGQRLPSQVLSGLRRDER